MQKSKVLSILKFVFTPPGNVPVKNFRAEQQLLGINLNLLLCDFEQNFFDTLKLISITEGNGFLGMALMTKQRQEFTALCKVQGPLGIKLHLFLLNPF